MPRRGRSMSHVRQLPNTIAYNCLLNIDLDSPVHVDVQRERTSIHSGTILVLGWIARLRFTEIK